MEAAGSDGLWRVQIALEHDEWDAIRRALVLVTASERFVIALSPSEDGETATLQLDVPAENQAGAEAVAEEIYAKARGEAGLPEAPSQTLGALSPVFGPPPWERMLEETRRLIEWGGRYELAVIRAQTAAELYAEAALDALTVHLREANEPVRNLLPKVNLIDRRSRVLLQAVTGSVITREPWWPDYRTHVERRNKVVHAALLVSEQQAKASRQAVRSFIRHLGWLWEGQPEDPFAGRQRFTK